MKADDLPAAAEVEVPDIDADDALKAFDTESLETEVPDVDEATNRRLLRKIDLNIMPLLCVIYGLNYLDKTTLSYMSVMGLQKDLHLHGQEYQWLGSIFYFGYLAWEYPATLLLQRLPLAKYSSFCVVMWGAVLCCMAGVNNYSSGLAVRFFLGLFESGVTPGFALITSQWYTKQEQGTRTGFWFSFNGWGQVFGGLVAYGIARSTQAHKAALEPWKIIPLFTGLLTICIGVIFFFWMPDNQLNARWLSKEDRKLAIQRIRANQQGIGNPHFKAYQVKEALLDPITWALALFFISGHIPGGGLSVFFNQIIVGFGYTSEQSLLYGTPAGAFEGICIILAGYLGDRYRERMLISSVFLLIAIFGMALMIGLPESNNAGRLVGYYISQASPAPVATVVSMIATNVAGYTKKTTVAAISLIAYCVGNIIGPQIFRPKDAPRYVGAETAMIACWAIGFFDLLFIRWYLTRQNKRKASIRAQPGYQRAKNQQWLDLTDRENHELIYTV